MLFTPASTTAGPLVPPTDGGKTIGPYALQSSLGRGPLGEVFEARDTRRGNSVVLKLLLPQHKSGVTAMLDAGALAKLQNQLAERLLTAAQACMPLQHPCIARVLEAGRSPQGVYVVSERLEGRTLREALDTGWRPRPSLAARIALRVAEALAHAHERGVVHGALKPSNVWLDDADLPQLLDFGLAQAVYGEGVQRADLPLDSLRYQAPEQLMTGAADARTDVRAVGLLLYEMLAGRPAFAGANAQDVMRTVLENQPAPISELRKNVPRTLVSIAMQAMTLDPGQRFGSAAELASSLTAWKNKHAARKDQPSHGKSSSRLRLRLRRRSGTQNWTRVLIVMASVALVGGAMAALWLPHLRAGSPSSEMAQTGRSTANPLVLDALAAAAMKPNSNPAATAAPASSSAPASTVAATKAATPEAGAAVAAAPAAVQGGPLAPTDAEQREAAYAAKRVGKVTLEIDPPAQVWVNGLPQGTTPPLTELNLPVGQQTIALRSAGYSSYAITVVVRHDQPVELRHRFTR